MDIVSFYEDYNISYLTSGHKHCRPGWVNTACPFCTGNPGYHLGAPFNGAFFYCWRCGWKYTAQVVAKLLQLQESAAFVIIKEYGGKSSDVPLPLKQSGDKPFKAPTNLLPLKANAKQYLAKRGFDATQIERDWGIMSTGPISLVDGTNYSHRIYIPVTWNRQVVSYQCRALNVQDSQALRYLACPKQREIVEHKHVLYGKQEYWGDVGICVEGPTDVWRFGPFAFATFGIEFTTKQVREIAKNFKHVHIVFDSEIQAQKQAKELAGELRFRNVKTNIHQIDGDPGSMKQKQADKFVQELLRF